MRQSSLVVLVVALCLHGICPASSEQLEPAITLDGFCPVTVVDDRRWVLGERGLSTVHRGQQFFFRTEEQRDAFSQNPDKYAPVLGGQVIVALASGRPGELKGKRDYGCVYHGRLFLFNSRSTFNAFLRSPDSYVQHLRLVEQATPWHGWQTRPEKTE